MLLKLVQLKNTIRSGVPSNIVVIHLIIFITQARNQSVILDCKRIGTE